VYIAAEVETDGPWTMARDPEAQRWSNRGRRNSEALILEHVGLVKRIARQFGRRMPAHVEVDDLIQAGMVGLVEAAGRYEVCAGASFATYATIRIRGAILDFAREADWLSRRLRRRIQDMDEAIRRIESETAKITTAAEVATALDMSLESYHHTRRDAETSRVLSLDDSASDHTTHVSDKVIDTSRNPADEVEQEQLRHVVAAAVDALPDNDRLILLLYYDQEYVLREIGEKLDLSESRVCQLHRRAVRRLRRLVQRCMRCDGLPRPEAVT
jgi:RNA polymerase sigma factor FliA